MFAEIEEENRQHEILEQNIERRMMRDESDPCMGQTTVSKCIKEVSDLIVHNLSNTWIEFPVTPEAKLAIKTGFMETRQDGFMQRRTVYTG
ncbi:unnamed protein product [Diabrotica balteata]|uniref:Uncharacterized protein n=1 Tax=Diabrotica balteata TaxID=107213 RepID=A0A9P0DX96_DIABA|nr:unnamed protein product [Diabrotica balteata]